MSTAISLPSSERIISSQDILNGRGQLGETVFINVTSAANIILTPNSMPGLDRYCSNYIFDISTINTIVGLTLPTIGSEVARGWNCRIKVLANTNPNPSNKAIIEVKQGTDVIAIIYPRLAAMFIANANYTVDYFIPQPDINGNSSGFVVAYNDDNVPIIAGPLDTGKLYGVLDAQTPIDNTLTTLIFKEQTGDKSTYLAEIDVFDAVTVIRRGRYTFEAKLVIQLVDSAPFADIVAQFTVNNVAIPTLSLISGDSSQAVLSASFDREITLLNSAVRLRISRTSLVGFADVISASIKAFYVTRVSGGIF